MSLKYSGAVPHDSREVGELRAHCDLAAEYLKAGWSHWTTPMIGPRVFFSPRTVAEAYVGLDVVAAEAGISRETLNRALSLRDNPMPAIARGLRRAAVA